VKLRKVLSDLIRVIADEAERNPEFERSIAAALGLGTQNRQPRQDAVNEGPRGAAGQRPKNRRPQPVLDPVEIARLGETELRTQLAPLSIEQLRDVVADFGMDPGKLVLKWKTADRIIDRIVAISLGRAQKGDAFRSEEG